MARSKSRSGATRKQDAGAPDRHLVAAVDRASRILLALTQSTDFLTLHEIASRTKLSKPTAFRILATLVANGLAFQNEANGSYGLGSLNLRLAEVILGGIRVRESARLVMRQVRNEINETVVLSVRQGDACYYVESLEGRQTIGHSQTIGVPLPLHVVAPGCAILATLPDDAVDDYLRHHPAASKSGTKSGIKSEMMGIARRKLLRQLETIRRQGHAASSGDASGAGHAIAVAIPSAKGASDASLHISFPKGRFTNDLEQRCIKTLKAAVRTIAEGRVVDLR
jgi:DNA-binding IclR family transcriptional regulator